MPFDPNFGLPSPGDVLGRVFGSSGGAPAAAAPVPSPPALGPAAGQGDPLSLPPGGGIQELFSLAASDPDTFATMMAGAGVPPPADMSGGPDVGAALTGMPLAEAAAGWDTQVNPAGAAPPGNPFAENAQSGMTGVRAPEAPEPLTPQLGDAPAAPRPSGSIDMGGVNAMIQAAMPKPPQRNPYELPSTLGRALLGR